MERESIARVAASAATAWPEGYEFELSSARGDTVAVVSVPATAIGTAESHELLAVRRFRAS